MIRFGSGDKYENICPQQAQIDLSFWIPLVWACDWRGSSVLSCIMALGKWGFGSSAEHGSGGGWSGNQPQDASTRGSDRCHRWGTARWVWTQSLEFVGTWLNVHVLSWKLPGFIAFNPTAFRPEAADTWHGSHLFSAECPLVSRRSKAWGTGGGKGWEPILSACSICYVFTIQNS